MDKETTLVNMVKEGSEGALCCYNHNKAVVYGSTSNASMDEEGKVFMDYMIERELEINHSDAPYSKSENLIRMIQNNHIKKASVGLYGGWYWCPIDKADMFDRVNGKYQCNHYPGDKVTQKIDGKDVIVEVIPKIKDGHLGELSTVWAGSNPDAAIVERAEWELEQGMLTKKRALHINRLFGVGLDLTRAKNDDSNNEGDKPVAIEKEELEQILKVVVEGFKTAMGGDDKGGDDSTADNSVIPKVIQDKLDDMEKEIVTLRKDSVDSEQQVVVSEARALYVKICGASIDSKKLAAFEEKHAKLTLAESQEDRDFLKDYHSKLEEGDDDTEVENRKSNERDSFDDAGDPVVERETFLEESTDDEIV